jgi:hypothetical protein
MATATVHLASVGGFAGIARCFALSEPYVDSGGSFNYLTLWVQPSFGKVVGPEVVIIPATETGAAAEPSLKRRPGSFVLHDEPITYDQFGTAKAAVDKIEGAYQWALLQIGYDYQVDWNAIWTAS